MASRGCLWWGAGLLRQQPGVQPRSVCTVYGTLFQMCEATESFITFLNTLVSGDDNALLQEEDENSDDVVSSASNTTAHEEQETVHKSLDSKACSSNGKAQDENNENGMELGGNVKHKSATLGLADIDVARWGDVLRERSGNTMHLLDNSKSPKKLSENEIKLSSDVLDDFRNLKFQFGDFPGIRRFKGAENLGKGEL